MNRVRHQRAEIPVKLNGVAAAREFFSGCFAEQDPSQETLWVAHLDQEARCVHLSRHLGDARGVDFPVREIIIDAALHATTSILLAHNHPSGDPRPSESDLRSTRRLATAADAIGCKLLDHLVFAGALCTSVRRLGYL
jgi:DNA repair protein RadC